MQTDLNNFGNRVDAELLSQVQAPDAAYDILIVASMLEWEVRTPQDLPIVSGIIWKRLDNDWTLSIDATLLYKEDNTITAEDLAKTTLTILGSKGPHHLQPLVIQGLASITAASKPRIL